ncbi:SAM-dependent methyltransferase [archaeon]|jgi:tRNA (guanine37-N1)-methyltransferase|nr:SAM-dependent methyltransferase [archaeon]MDP6548142.1 class I SAM-dependent methyltransferase family protein [Candidatus Woesearchaeota archaeon]|tara:strand:- start:15275 stop:16105 length:831 start_codon:yes stop_codon:yes gene_type:complete
MTNKLKDFLKNKLTKKELDILPASFDVIGNIMIFSDFPEQLEKKEKIIGNEILKNYKHIRSVFKKTKKFSGKFRTSKLSLLAGDKSRETLYKENNTRLNLDVEKVYFSSRSSTERKRIFQLVKPNEIILVLFSGCGPYPIIISRNSQAKEIYSVEMNPTACKYQEKNIKLNKIKNISLIKGDARRILLNLNKKFDRILMPLPKGAENFLDLALIRIKKQGIIHFYTFSEEDKYDNITDMIKDECKKKKKKCRILRTVKCGQFSPRVFRICVDFKVS